MALARYLRISLRQIAVLVTLACIAFAFYAQYVRRQRVAAFVDDVLASEGPVNVSWSYEDVQAAMLVGYADRTGLAVELLRRLHDPDAPGGQDGIILQTLGGMTETPGVVEGLLDLLETPCRDRQQSGIIDALQHCKSDAETVVERLAACTRNDDANLRLSACYSLERMAYEQPRLQRLILPILIVGMGDPDERIRGRTAGAFNILNGADAVAELRRLLNDPSPNVQVMAARSLWKTTGDRAPLVQIATRILVEDGEDLETKREAAYWVKDVGELPQATLEALTVYAAFDQRPPFSEKGDVPRYQLANTARQILNAHRAAVDEP